jgi:hypothetical protein
MELCEGQPAIIEEASDGVEILIHKYPHGKDEGWKSPDNSLGDGWFNIAGTLRIKYKTQGIGPFMNRSFGILLIGDPADFNLGRHKSVKHSP